MRHGVGYTQGCVRGRHGRGQDQDQGQIVSYEARPRTPMKSYMISEAPLVLRGGREETAESTPQTEQALSLIHI